MRIGIIGAGLAGLTAARGLAEAGHAVILFDKARGPGGRMSTRRTETAQGMAFFDHGAQYFTVRDAGFAETVERWEADGVAARWAAAGDNAWVGTPGMNAIIKAEAAAHDVRWNCRIERIVREGASWRFEHDAGSESFDTAIVAVPAEQVAPLLASHAPEWAALAEATVSQPCWTVMASFAERVDFGPDCLRNAGAIGAQQRQAGAHGTGKLGRPGIARLVGGASRGRGRQRDRGADRRSGGGDRCGASRNTGRAGASLALCAVGRGGADDAVG